MLVLVSVFTHFCRTSERRAVCSVVFVLLFLAPCAAWSAGGAETPSDAPLPPAAPPKAGEPFDDREILQYLEAEGRRLLAAGRVRVLKSAPRVCSVPLGEDRRERLTLPELAARSEAATVVLGEFFKEPKKKEVEFASAAGGFVVNPTGAIVTSMHVVGEKNSRGFVAMMRDGRVFAVREALAADDVQDLVVLQLDLPDGQTLPALPLAAAPAPPGAPVAVMSHPDEHFWMLTTGVVARQTVWRGERGNEFYTTITADFAKGSSGCPVLDEYGNVIAIVNNTESVYYDNDGKKKQYDLQMVIKNATAAFVARELFRSGP